MLTLFYQRCLIKESEVKTMYINQSDLFWGLSQNFVQEVMNIAEKESLEEGDVLFNDGESPDHLFILIKGVIKLVLGETGKLVYTGNRVGEAFGWSSLIGGEVYTATAICAEPSVVLKIERKKLMKILERDTASGYLFFKQLAAALGSRLMQMYKLISQ